MRRAPSLERLKIQNRERVNYWHLFNWVPDWDDTDEITVVFLESFLVFSKIYSFQDNLSLLLCTKVRGIFLVEMLSRIWSHLLQSVILGLASILELRDKLNQQVIVTRWRVSYLFNRFLWFWRCQECKSTVKANPVHWLIFLTIRNSDKKRT